MLIESPWARVNTPTLIPDGDLHDVLTGMDPVSYAELVRSNLVPRTPQPADRERWDRMWVTIDQDPQLAERTFDVLEEFLEASQAAAHDDGVPEAQQRRAQKFYRFCDEAWRRLQKAPAEGEPLAWAGRAATAFNSPSRRVIHTLVDAVSAHRDLGRRLGPTAEADQALWNVLGRLNLDPGRTRR